MISSSVALAPRLSWHERGDDLAVPGVRRRDDLRDAHRRVADEVALDLDRRDVLAADLEHVLQPPGVDQPAVGVELGQVLRVEVAVVVEGGRGQLGVLVVALEERVALEAQLADDAGRQGLAGLGVGDLDLHALQRAPERVHARVVAVVGAREREVARALGRAVGGDLRRPRHPRLELHQPLGHADRLDEPDRAQVVAVEVGVVEHLQPDRLERGVDDRRALLASMSQRVPGSKWPAWQNFAPTEKRPSIGTIPPMWKSGSGSQKLSSAVSRSAARRRWRRGARAPRG